MGRGRDLLRRALRLADHAIDAAEAVHASPTSALFDWRPRALLFDRGALGLVLPALGIVAYAVYCRETFGYPLAFALSRGRAEYGASAFWAARSWWRVAEAFRGGRLRTAPVLASYVPWSVIPTVGAVALLRRRAWLPLAPFALLLMALYLGASLLGLGRFSASCARRTGPCRCSSTPRRTRRRGWRSTRGASRRSRA